MLVLWKLVSVHLEIVLLLVQERCTVCAKRTIGLDIVFNAPMVLLGDEAQVEARFIEIVLILTQDRCAVCAERNKGLEIILDAPDGTPR